MYTLPECILHSEFTHHIAYDVKIEFTHHTAYGVKIEGFYMFPAVCKKNCGGGSIIAKRHGLCSSMIIDFGDNAEFLTVRLNFGQFAVILILAYGPQEKEKTNLVEDFLNNISVQLNRSVMSGDPVMLIGDLNAKIGKDIIKGDIHDMSTNGEHLMSIIEKYNLTVVNSIDICRGLFTRVNNKNTMEKSILDYVLVSNDLARWVVGLQIDEAEVRKRQKVF